MTLVEVIDAARGLLGAETLVTTRTAADNTSSFWTDALLTTYHNLVQQEIQQEVIMAFEDHFVTSTNVALVAGVAQYALPADFVKMRRVEDIRTISNPTEIVPTSINQRGGNPSFFSLNSGGAWAGAYYMVGNQIVFTDTPSITDTSAIRLHYVHRLADVTALTSTSEIPAEHHRLLVWGIVKHALFQQQSDTTLANAEYDKLLARLKALVEDRQIQRSRRVARQYSNDTGGYL